MWDAEIQAAVDALSSTFPEVHGMEPDELRSVIATRRVPSPEVRDVEVDELSVPVGDTAVGVRTYRPRGAVGPLPLIVFFHGGGFVFCDLDSHDDFCREMSDRAGVMVASVDYRRAPEAKAPTAATDGFAALSWLVANAERVGVDADRVVVAGDSAGGNIAAVVAILARDRGVALHGQVLLYPVIDPACDTESYRRYGTGYGNDASAMRWYWQQYLGADLALPSPPELAVPSRAASHAGLPAALLVTAGLDPLCDEGRSYADTLAEAGVAVTHRHYPGAFHGFVTTQLEAGRAARAVLWSDLARMIGGKPEPAAPADDVRDIVVVGAGIAGLYATHAALERGFDVICLEGADDLGGTWYHNRYPGCRCDVESVDYSYTFDERLQREWRWSERYATQPEILRYLKHVADRFGLRRHIRFGSRVRSAVFDDETSCWTVVTETGAALVARYVVFATGSLSTPNLPAIPGVEDFEGTVLHTAAWPKEPPELAGRRVGVIGTGSSGIQLIPKVAEEAAELTVFQRTPNFSVPAFNHELDEGTWSELQQQYAERRRRSWRSGGGSPHEFYPLPALEIDRTERDRAFEDAWRRGGVLFSKTFADQLRDIRVNDLAREFFERKLSERVLDPAVREDLTPRDHPIGAKRICTDSGYYETFNRANVRLVNLRRHPIERVLPEGVRTREGDHRLDVLVFATGFDALTGALLAIDVRGSWGASLADAWRDGPVSYLGMQVPGFPNMFVVNGPGSPAVLVNMVLTSEQQVDWILSLLETARGESWTRVEPRADSAVKWNEHLAELAAGTLFPQADSWYVGANIEGKPRMFMLYAGGFAAYIDLCEEIRKGGYEGFVMSRALSSRTASVPVAKE